MPKINDLTNKTFGELTAIHRTRSSPHGYYWLCQCSCGKQKEILGANLIRGNTKSCGCLKNTNKTNTFIPLDISNQKFGYWTPLYRSSRQSKNGNYYWMCRCDCGIEKEVLLSSLTSGKSKSCGCIKSYGEQKISSILAQNNISFTREYSLDGCLTEKGNKCRFDFAIFDNNNQLQYLIEFDGKQHFEETIFDLATNQSRDKIKNIYCLAHNIPLYRIPYFELDNLNNLLDILNPKYLIIQQ